MNLKTLEPSSETRIKATERMSSSSEAMNVSPEMIKQQIQRLEIQIDEIDELLAVDPDNQELITLREELDEKIDSIEKALGGLDIDLNMRSEDYVHVPTPYTMGETLESRARQSPLIANEKAIYLSALSDVKAGLNDKTNRVTYDLDPGNPKALDAIITAMLGRTADSYNKTHLPAENVDNPREAIHGKDNNSQLNGRTINEKLLGIKQRLDEKLTGLENNLGNMSRLEQKLDGVLDLLGSFPSDKEPYPRAPYGAAVHSVRFSAGKHWESTKDKLIAELRKEPQRRETINSIHGHNFKAASVEPAKDVDQVQPAKVKNPQPVPMGSSDITAELRAANPPRPIAFLESEKNHQQMDRLQELDGSSSKWSLLLANLKNDDPIYPAPSIAPNSQTRKPDSTLETAPKSAAVEVPEKNHFVADVKYPIHAKEQKTATILNRMETLNFHELPGHVMCDKERNAMSSVVEGVTGIPKPKVPASTDTQKPLQKVMGKSQNNKRIDFLVQRHGCSRHEAIIALQKGDGDVWEARRRLSIAKWP